MRKKLRRELATLPAATLGQLSSLAEQWSPPDKFAIIVVLLRAWLQEQLYAVAGVGTPVGGMATGEALVSSREAWLKTVLWIERLIQQAAVINLNRRLVLEAVFIRLARLQGASC